MRDIHVSPEEVVERMGTDLDSMVSAISYAFLRQETETSTNRFYIPVISIPSADYALRGECVYAFSRFLGPAQELTFLDHVKLSPESSLILVDHNQLCPSLSHLSDRVTCIIDHHKDDELYRSAEPRLIEPVGSTCSLVALEWKSASVDGGIVIEESVASLLLSGILLDTICLDPQYGRTTPKDLEVSLVVYSTLDAANAEYYP